MPAIGAGSRSEKLAGVANTNFHFDFHSGAQRRDQPRPCRELQQRIAAMPGGRDVGCISWLGIGSSI
jgi:hypothetical protein